jgi:hypothetical protein
VFGPDARGIGERARVSDGLGVENLLEELPLDRDAQRARGRDRPGTLGLVGSADQPQGQRIPVGLALAGLDGRQRGQDHPGDHPDDEEGDADQHQGGD